MLGNFIYSNPTKLYFGENSLDNLSAELAKYGKSVLLVYGGGSIKQSGLYSQVVTILKAAGKEIFEDAGVMPNPTVEKLYEGCQRARDGKVDFILAVGGGSVCDYAKAVSVSAYCKGDPWDKYFVRFEDVDCDIIPVGCVLTMVGTGSEMNGGSVITNHAQKLKVGHVFSEDVFPKFSVLNPVYTYTLPKYQMVAGFFDIMSHILEQYFSGIDDNTSDYIMEGLLKSLIHSSRIAIQNPTDYEARSNIMWIATWALNTLVAKGKTTDWMVHMLGQAVGAYTNATHGMTLSAVSIPYYTHILPHGLQKFKRYAVNVWEVSSNGKTDEAVALEGLARMKAYMEELGLAMNIKTLGVTDEMLAGSEEMAVCRIEKTKDYTVMANHHLRNKELSLKAKGLLSLMLSLPEDWDYTVKGLAYICKDGIDSINGAIKELEITGYMSRQRVRNDRGQLTNTEYTIREYPKADTPTEGEPTQESPIWENPTQATPVQEEPHQLNTYLLTTEPSNPYQSYPCKRGTARCDGIGYDAYEEIKEMVFENIEYEHLCKHGGISMRERLDEVADIIIETLCSTKDTINIAGEDYPARLVKDKMLKITSSHIEYVFDCLNKNTTYVRNIKRYLLATLFNAPSTIDSYYSALVNHDLYSPNH